MDYQQAFETIDAHVQKKEFNEAKDILEESFETVLRDLYARLNRSVSSGVYSFLVETEEKTGHGRRLAKFGLRELVDLYQRGHVLMLVERHLHMKLERARQIPWDELATFFCDGSDATADDLIYYRTIFEVLLDDLGLAGIQSQSHQMPPGRRPDGVPGGTSGHGLRCPACGNSLQAGWSVCPICGTTLGSGISSHPDPVTPFPAEPGQLRSADEAWLSPSETDVPPDSMIRAVFVEPGQFLMGQSDNADNPVHRATIARGFLIALTPTTFELYDHYCHETGTPIPNDERWGRGSRPVINVTWYDAIRFANWLSQEEGLQTAYQFIDGDDEPSVSWNAAANGWRLPTEQEWEFAARGGVASSAYTYAGGDRPRSVAWFAGNARKRTRPVGRKDPNQLGLYDMNGNVWEWCWDVYDANYFRDRGRASSGSSVSVDCRGLRGGAWITNPSSLTVATHIMFEPTYAANSVGFRLVRNVE